MLMVKLFFLCAINICIDAAKILAIYPCPSISHQVVFRPITMELIKRGHEVTVLTTDPYFKNDTAPKNLREIDVHDISYKSVKDFIPAITGSEDDLINQVLVMATMIPRTFEEQMKVKEVQDLINHKTRQFDLILLEAFFIQVLGFTHIFKAPAILVSSFGPFIGTYEIMGAPTHPTLYHNLFRQKLYNLNLWEKVTELYNYFRVRYILSSAEENYNRQIKSIFGPNTPPLSVLKNNVDMLLLNVNPIWEGNYPVPPNVIHMGGLHQKPPKELPKDLQQYLDSSKNGVIYFSFGTNVVPSSLSQEKMKIFEDVFSQLPYNIIWKWDSDKKTVKSKNIKIYKWLPQSDLLRHPNVKLFITQGGLQSTDESITAGVPLIGIPMLGDQWYNVEKYVHHKIGVKLILENLTENQLKNAIIEVIQDKRYRENIARLRSLMQDQPQKPLDRALWWIEYVLRHGGAKHLRAPAANISWTEYYELELVSILLCSIMIFILLITFLVRYSMSYASKYVKKKQM
ncbi:unnamed protein product [Parnassius mnemosyne]|uniref:UDP-glucuronosyltransferase n=1 Tax=Parnassius mnemosyne TaxID=213953 RepID=A0AAV1L2I9_9NEOP